MPVKQVQRKMGGGKHRVRGRSKKTKVPLKNVNRVRSANAAPTLNTFLRNFFRNAACFTDFLNACEKTLVSFGNTRSISWSWSLLSKSLLSIRTLLYIHRFIHISTMFYTSLFSRINYLAVNNSKSQAIPKVTTVLSSAQRPLIGQF